jgi:cell wall assembly regulator SMI1
MKETLIRLDELIRQNRPDFYENLDPGLRESEIAALERRFDFSVPAHLKELYRWKNGQNSNCREFFVNNSEFVPLAEVLENRAALKSMIGDDFTVEHAPGDPKRFYAG